MKIKKEGEVKQKSLGTAAQNRGRVEGMVSANSEESGQDTLGSEEESNSRSKMDMTELKEELRRSASAAIHLGTSQAP